MSAPPFLGEPEDPMERMTPEQERILARWAKWGLLALALLALLAGLVIGGARG